MVHLLAVLLLYMYNAEEPWEVKENLLRMPVTTYINAGMFYTKEALDKAKDKDHFYERVMLKIAQIYSWHNIIYKVIYEEKWETDKINIYKTTGTIKPGKMLSDITTYGIGLKINSMNVATLLTDHASSSSTIGLAQVGIINTFCGNYILGGSYLNFYDWSVAITIAHETGHCLGLNHVEGGACIGPNGYCIMSAGVQHWSQSFPPAFSAISITWLINRANYGLEIPNAGNKNLYPACGNGIVEEGEECDCGFEASCKLKGAINCCNYTTCKLIGKSKCSDGPCCKNCEFVKGVPCRPSVDKTCDITEYCTGTSQFCLPDDYKPDGTPCGDGLYCTVGKCTNNSIRCSAITRNHDVSDDECRFIYDKKYSKDFCKRYGGYYCKEKNVLCAMVACKSPIHINGVHYEFFKEGVCTVYSGYIANMASKNTDGLSCGESSVCMAGDCVDASSNVAACSSVRCAPSMACRMGKCHLSGSAGTACENVFCNSHEVCSTDGKCLFVPQPYVSLLDKDFFSVCYVGFTIIALAMATTGVVLIEFLPACIKNA